MSVKDYVLQQQVRGILVRNFVDTRRLEFNVIGETVYLRGTFVLLYEHPQYNPSNDRTISGRVLMVVERELLRLAGVQGVEADFTNWVKVGGTWATRA